MPYHSDILGDMPKNEIYPRPGTRAAQVLDYIFSNEGTTTNGIISGLKYNPSVVRKCLVNLLAKGRITDHVDGNGHHNWRAKART